MTAALKTKNFEIAEEKGISTAGPWKVEFGEGEVKLLHYGHRIGRIFQLGPGRAFEITPREGYGLSKSDRDGLYVMIDHYAEADERERWIDIVEFARKAQDSRNPYSEEIQNEWRNNPSSNREGPNKAYPFDFEGNRNY